MKKSIILLFLVLLLTSCTNNLLDVFVDKDVLAQNNETKIFENDFNSSDIYKSWTWNYIKNVQLSDNWKHFLLKESLWYEYNLI